MYLLNPSFFPCNVVNITWNAVVIEIYKCFFKI